MRRSVILGVGVLVLVGLVWAGPTASAGDPRTPPIGATTLELNENHIAFGNVLRAWIGTGSVNPACLVTVIDESVTGLFDERPAITTVCSARDWDGGGVVLTVTVGNQDLPTDQSFVIDYTLYQQGAKGYAAPVLYDWGD